jgi:glycerate 2-kinase
MQTGLHAVEGRRCVSQALRASAPLAGPVWVAAIGKAALAMAAGAHEALGACVERTLIITRDAVPPGLPVTAAAEVLYGAHPLPDQSSLDAGARLLAWVDELPPAVQPLFLISGGASSLVEVLGAGVTLAQLQDLNRAALAQGLAIGEFNARRIRISRIKGGQLAQRLKGRAGRALFISDVPGDDVAVIGSGIMGPPPAGPDHIQRCVVASVDAAVAAVAARGRELGLVVHAPVRRFADSAARLAARFAHELSLTPAQLCVWGGESTLALPERPGRGGRNQHLALAAARLIAGHPELMLLAVGTDGSDGVTDDAGALVDAESCSRLTLAQLDADVCLRAADSATALSASGDLVHTGPTGTNVGDLVIGLKLTAASVRSLPQPRGGERMRVL